MRRYIRYMLPILLLGMLQIAAAQGIQVRSFRHVPMDITANIQGTSYLDKFGEPATLIKVVTPIEVKFDTGVTNNLLVHTESHLREKKEIWIWVSSRTRVLSIYGNGSVAPLRGYPLPVPDLLPAATYELVLDIPAEAIAAEAQESGISYMGLIIGLIAVAITIGAYLWYRRRKSDIVTIPAPIEVVQSPIPSVISATLDEHYLVIRVSPVDACVTIDDNPVDVVDGAVTVRLKRGTYRYEVQAAMHAPESGTLTISDKKEQLDITLRPLCGSFDVRTDPPGAKVSIDGTEIGITPDIFGNIPIGTHILRLTKEGCTPVEQQVTIEEGKTATLSLTLVARINRTFMVKGVSFTMIPVEGGTFTMGATSEQGSDACDDEKPAHRVTLSDYYIGETEVTQALWQAVMDDNPSYFKGDLQRPVEYVSWNDCQEFIEKLNTLTGQYFRLPTEAEWEYAARGGNKSKGYKYAGSNDIDDVAWYSANSGSTSHPVKSKTPNELGLYDMSGNVWEWCGDRYYERDYKSLPQTNPTGPTTGSNRVFRGGSWDYYAKSCRVSYRNGGMSGFKYCNLSFRLALSE